MFIQHLATTTHNVVKAERKPRRNIQYRDVSSAVAKTDNLEFAVDVVPKTTTYKEFKKKQDDKERVSGKGKEKAKDGVSSNGQMTLEAKLAEKANDTVTVITNGTTNGTGKKDAVSNGTGAASSSASAPAPAPAKPEPAPEAMEVDPQPERVEDSEPEDDPAAMQLEMEMRGPPRPAPAPEARRSTGFTAINGSR